MMMMIGSYDLIFSKYAYVCGMLLSVLPLFLEDERNGEIQNGDSAPTDNDYEVKLYLIYLSTGGICRE